MKCWTCGRETHGFEFTCPNCKQTKKIVKACEAIGPYRSAGIQTVVEFPNINFILAELSIDFSELAESLSEIASVIEWGFEELNWKIEQATEILKSIDRTLKIPSQVQANEWRGIAEELRRRGVLEESKKFFLKSLKTNPLDYRTYIGLGKTYLQLENFDEAKNMWEKSLPHAPETPEGNIANYKSYSYRLIGRVLFCQEKYQEAISVLRLAIDLSNEYSLAYYDHALYCCLIGNKEDCLSSLGTAIAEEPNLIELAKKETRFKDFKNEIENFEPSVIHQKILQKIMGDNFLGIEEVAKYFGIQLNEEELLKTAEIPFSEKTIQECKDTHVLFLGVNHDKEGKALTINRFKEIFPSDDQPRFFSYESWYDNQWFVAEETPELRWYLIRKSIIKSRSKTYEEQEKLLKENEEIEKAVVYIYMMLLMFKATGERLFENNQVRCKDVYSGGRRVGVGGFGLSGLVISDDWGDDCIGYFCLALARKFD